MNLEEFKYGGTNVTAFRMVTITKMTRNIIDYDDDDILFIGDQNDYHDDSFDDIFIGVIFNDILYDKIYNRLIQKTQP